MKTNKRKTGGLKTSMSRTWLRHEKLAAMKVLENHMGNMILASKDLGIHKTTLYSWKREFWEEYLETRDSVNANIMTVQAKQMLLFGGTQELTAKTTELFKMAVDYFMDGHHFEALNSKEKVQLVNVIVPYILEKKVVMGVKGQTPVQNNNFFQNIYQQIKQGSEYQHTIQGGQENIQISE
jgi:transposase-like protein